MPYEPLESRQQILDTKHSCKFCGIHPKRKWKIQQLMYRQQKYPYFNKRYDCDNDPLVNEYATFFKDQRKFYKGHNFLVRSLFLILWEPQNIITKGAISFSIVLLILYNMSRSGGIIPSSLIISEVIDYDRPIISFVLGRKDSVFCILLEMFKIILVLLIFQRFLGFAQLSTAGYITYFDLWRSVVILASEIGTLNL